MTRSRWLAGVTVPLLTIAVAAACFAAADVGELAKVGPVAIAAAVGLPSVILGNVVAWNRPHNVVGPLLAWSGLVLGTTGATDIYSSFGPVTGPAAQLRVSDAFVALSQGAWMWLYVPVAELLLLFPDGRTSMASRRDRTPGHRGHLHPAGRHITY